MKVTITLELGHVIEEDSHGRIIEIKNSEDEVIVEASDHDDAVSELVNHISDVLAEADFEAATIDLDWDA